MWHWKDAEVQSVQVVRLAQERRATLPAVFNVASGKLVPVSDEVMRNVTPTPDPKWVVAVGDCAADADLAVSIAKSYVAEHAPDMVQLCVQLHGGIGVTWEHDLHLYLRRVTLYRSMYGTPEDHNLLVYRMTKELESA